MVYINTAKLDRHIQAIRRLIHLLYMALTIVESSYKVCRKGPWAKLWYSGSGGH